MTWVLFCFCGALIISVTIFLSRSPGRFGFHDPTWHFPLAHGAAGSPYRSPGTTSPAGRALNQHCQRQTHTDRCAAQGAWASVHPEGVSPLDRRETLAGQGRTPPRPPPAPPRSQVKVRPVCERVAEMGFCSYEKLLPGAS